MPDCAGFLMRRTTRVFPAESRLGLPCSAARPAARPRSGYGFDRGDLGRAERRGQAGCLPGQPDRDRAAVPAARHVPDADLHHSLPATAFAFAVGVGHVLPWSIPPLVLLAAAVGYSRVHTGSTTPEM